MNINLVPLTILILLVSQAIQLQKKKHFLVKTNNRNGKGKHYLIKTVANRGETTSIADKDYKLSRDVKGQTPSIADKDVEAVGVGNYTGGHSRLYPYPKQEIKK